MTTCITKSTINLWDALPQEIIDEICEYNVIPYLNELKDKQLLIMVVNRSGLLGSSKYCHISLGFKCRKLDLKRDDRWLCSMGWKETTPYLKMKCKENGIKSYSKLRKKECIKALMSI